MTSRQPAGPTLGPRGPARVVLGLAAVTLVAATLYSVAFAWGAFLSDGPDAQHTSWTDYGGGPDQSKYVVLDEITKENVHELDVAWFYPTGDDRGYQFSPIVVDGVMFVLAKDQSLVALDATNGEELWTHPDLGGIARRGINYWESEDGTDRRLLFQRNDGLHAVDAATGESILTFGENGFVDLKVGLDRDPETIARVQSATPGRIFENLILLGSATGENYMATPGHLRAYDVVTGDLVWTFRTIPHPGEYGYETWPPDAYQYVGGTNTWGEITLDEARGIAYFPTGSPTYDFYGADRIGQNLFGNSLLALDARTGERLWHFQAVHHDLWDYDLAAAPQLVTVRHDGRRIDAVALATKHGFLFAFDRVTGDPLWPIEDRPVPPSHVPGEEAWPTQPYPTVLPPFSRQEMTVDDLNPFLFTPEEREEWTERISELVETGRTGLFVPLSDEHPTLTLPGAVGGASWGNTAANPETGMVYVFSIAWPSFYGNLEPRTAPDDEVSPGAGGGGGYGRPYPEGVDAPEVRYFGQGYGLGNAWVIRPPWSKITAYDLNEGTIRWQRAVGTDLRAAEAGFEETGVPQAQRHGMVVTSTGIVFSTSRDGRVYAFDADDGAELWRATLPMGSEGLPALYEADGRHYLVVTATTQLRWSRGVPAPVDEDAPPPERGYVVFALPD